MSWIELVAQSRPPQIPEGVTPPENAADWYRIVNSAEDADETDVYVYDAIGGWMGTTADDFVRDLKDVTSSRINLRLNSPGGSVFEGITIANALRTHPASVTVYVDGLAASIASVIALAGDRLVMMPQSQLMIHDASGACYGNAADMQSMVDLLDKQSDNIADAYADRAGGTAAGWRDLMKAETWYSAKEAVVAGLADEVMAPPKKEAVPDSRMQSLWDLSMYRYAGRDNAPAPRPVALAVSGAARNVAPAWAADRRQIVVKLDLVGEDVRELILEPLRAELKALAATPPAPRTEDAKPPFLTPEEETEDAADPDEAEAAADPDEVEDADTEEVDDASDPDDPEAAKTKKKLPPWLKPKKGDEDEEDEPDDAADPEEPEAAIETHDQALRGLFASIAPSPCADDVLNRLKEAS